MVCCCSKSQPFKNIFLSKESGITKNKVHLSARKGKEYCLRSEGSESHKLLYLHELYNGKNALTNPFTMITSHQNVKEKAENIY